MRSASCPAFRLGQMPVQLNFVRPSRSLLVELRDVGVDVAHRPMFAVLCEYLRGLRTDPREQHQGATQEPILPLLLRRLRKYLDQRHVIRRYRHRLQLGSSKELFKAIDDGLFRFCLRAGIAVCRVRRRSDPNPVPEISACRRAEYGANVDIATHGQEAVFFFLPDNHAAFLPRSASRSAREPIPIDILRWQGQ
ncbi:hypothetical protein AGR3A_Cc250129 [Agrobacterium tomkonis CFBP 6623]|uniref:Uncharacterized protein n=1 Tax=Agrobacterium tomkonis CFBP 6623 TaxID=1183432 RepID=A0A1S7PE34_9HYPH|nr:hypothetical protein AGR3A_Cc250129 [Agrobacterium tomkonis CFBP 6623]